MTFSCECAVAGLEGVGRGLGWLKLQGGAQTGLAVGLQGRPCLDTVTPRGSQPPGSRARGPDCRGGPFSSPGLVSPSVMHRPWGGPRWGGRMGAVSPERRGTAILVVPDAWSLPHWPNPAGL